MMLEKFYIICVIGFSLSLYALHIERSAEADIDYVAFCDISHRISCSKVFLSEYGKIFSYLGLIAKDSFLDFPNAFFGSIFYLLIALIYYVSKMSRTTFVLNILLLLAVTSIALSAFLSYILAFLLQDVCVICYSTYVCNILIFYWSWQRTRKF